MMSKYLSFSISKDCVILTYLWDAQEVTAVIEPYTFATYLSDLKIVNDRMNDSLQKLHIDFNGEWMTWREFIIESQTRRIYTNELLQRITERHHETESIKNAYYALNN